MSNFSALKVGDVCAEIVASDLAQTKQHALLKQHSFSVNFE